MIPYRQSLSEHVEMWSQVITLPLTGTILAVTVEKSQLINPMSLLVVADVKQDMLETIIPKSEYDSIMVVLGEHRGQVSKGPSGSSVLQHLCTGLNETVTNDCIYTFPFRLAVFSSGTRTSAERWFNSTDMRRKCSPWTMTPFVTMWEQQTIDLHISNFYSDAMSPLSSHWTLNLDFLIFRK